MTSTALAPFPLQRTRLQTELLAAYDELIPRLAWDRARIRQHQRARLRLLLRHAAEHSPFHAARLAGVDLDAVQPDDLSALPVMSKADLMASFDEVVTDRRITRDRAEATLAAVADVPAVLLDTALVLASGGTSGPRGIFLMDGPACVQYFGSITRSLVARLRSTGVPPGGLRAAIVAAGSPVHATRTAPWVTAEGRLPFSFTSVPATLPLAEIVDRLNAISPMALFGYPTVLARLAAEQRAGRLRITPGLVTVTSETLTPDLRAALREGFGVPIVDGYGSTEGLVASTPPDDEVMVVAEDGCIVELVDDRDRPVPPGTPSAAVLITVLENRLQPLIRYRITDAFVAQPPAAEHGYLRARVEGRSDDVLQFGEVVVHPLVLRTVLVHRREVVDYQVRQTADGVAVQVVAPGGVDGPELAQQLATALSAAGVPRTTVTVEEVTELPRDARTGKLRRFVPAG